MLNREGRDCNPRTQNPGETRKRKTGSPKKMGRTHPFPKVFVVSFGPDFFSALQPESTSTLFRGNREIT